MQNKWINRAEPSDVIKIISIGYGHNLQRTNISLVSWCQYFTYMKPKFCTEIWQDDELLQRILCKLLEAGDVLLSDSLQFHFNRSMNASKRLTEWREKYPTWKARFRAIAPPYLSIISWWGHPASTLTLLRKWSSLNLHYLDFNRRFQETIVRSWVYGYNNENDGGKVKNLKEFIFQKSSQLHQHWSFRTLSRAAHHPQKAT